MGEDVVSHVRPSQPLAVQVPDGFSSGKRADVDGVKRVALEDIECVWDGEIRLTPIKGLPLLSCEINSNRSRPKVEQESAHPGLVLSLRVVFIAARSARDVGNMFIAQVVKVGKRSSELGKMKGEATCGRLRFIREKIWVVRVYNAPDDAEVR